MAMLTTPARSPRTPPRAPKTSGTARASEPASRPTTGSEPPEAAQVRKPAIQATAKTHHDPPGGGALGEVAAQGLGGQQRADRGERPGGGHRRDRQLGRAGRSRCRQRAGRSRRRTRPAAAPAAAEGRGEHGEDDQRLAAHHRDDGDHRPGRVRGRGQGGCGAHFASLAGSRKIARTRGGAAMKRTIRDWTTSTMSTGMPSEACMAKPPALKAPNRRPAPRMPSGRDLPEQGHGDGVEADAGVEVDRDAAGDRAEHLVGAGQADEGAGDQHHDDVGAADVDAGRAGGAGVLADGADAVAERRAVEQPPHDGRRRSGPARSRGAG